MTTLYGARKWIQARTNTGSVVFNYDISASGDDPR